MPFCDGAGYSGELRADQITSTTTIISPGHVNPFIASEFEICTIPRLIQHVVINGC